MKKLLYTVMCCCASIAGLHENGTTDSLEVISFGEMYEENGETIVKYEEAMDDVEGEDCEMVQSQLKIRDGQVEILKEGGTRTHMVSAGTPEA